MKIKPTGFNVLVKMGAVEQEVQSGALAGFKLRSDEEQDREEGGYYAGTVVAIGPTAHLGYEGCEGETAEERAKEWGYKVGDQVYFGRYAGDDHLSEIPGLENHRLIVDKDITGNFGEG